MAPEPVPRALHVVENLDRGAVETWLIRMLRHARSRGVAADWSFYCTLNRIGALDVEARRLGAPVLYSPVPIAKRRAFILALRGELKRGGYDVLHCHHDLVSAVYLGASLGLPIRRRIVHIHNGDQAVLTPSRVKQLLLRPTMRRLCLAYADRIVGNSHGTLDRFLRGRRRRPMQDIVHYYGVNASPYESAVPDRIGLRQSLNLPEDSLILLFAGRMVREKNPAFVLDVLKAMRHVEAGVVAVFAGIGPDEHTVLKRAQEMGIAQSVRMLGWRTDVPAIMACCDWFILPRVEDAIEGFGIAVVEAQLAGTRLLVSEAVQDDALLASAQCRRLPLGAGAEAWATAAIAMLREPAPCAAAASRALTLAGMSMDTALNALLHLHA